MPPHSPDRAAALAWEIGSMLATLGNQRRHLGGRRGCRKAPVQPMELLEVDAESFKTRAE